ncbi:hypothetical protein ACFFS2_03520 [Streptomyces aurantiacus]|uniref:AbiJ-NTD3 domain-containing protein n=1 Tax=Streptomyces aurantiacus TaxID=47760 RepID=A0A7G1PB86_9ACTN|nr:hypothetical protein [Streptomyces aurantiacus]BCL31020.1 hypothetical protein GCM10017557_58790 [Streptomyces aurantiacus]
MTLEDLLMNSPAFLDGEQGESRLNRHLVDQLRHGPVVGFREEDVAYHLLCLLETELPGNNQGIGLTDHEVADVLRCADAVLARLNIIRRVPFRTRREYWEHVNTQGSITEICGPILGKLADLERDASRAGFRGVNGDLRNIIFAAKDKPEIVWINFDQGIYEITNNADCLKYDRPIPAAGLTMTDLLDWWKHRDGNYSLAPAVRLQRLKTKLADSCSPKSPLEKHLLRVYWEFAHARGFDATPAILPQVYLHYDPIAQRVRDDQGGRIIPLQVRDFMLFTSGGRRIILEIDGIQHYSSDDGLPAPREYAKMTKEDRRLRLQGYEVYRFGGYEFQERQEPDKMLMEFFAEVLAL